MITPPLAGTLDNTPLYPLFTPSLRLYLYFRISIPYHISPTNTPDIDHNITTRRVVNLARLLAHLLCTFHLPLAVLKPIDIGANLNASMILFLATFFMSLFSAKVTEDTFQTILDRVATTKDFMTVRDGILFFLQTHLKQIPRGLEVTHPPIHSNTHSNALANTVSNTLANIPSNTKHTNTPTHPPLTLPLIHSFNYSYSFIQGYEMMQKRRRMAVSTMESMSVLDFSAARLEEEEENH